MEFKIKTFDELSNEELYSILRLRSEIFVVEQNCVYQDMDNKDLKAFHLMAIDEGQIVAYLRILNKGVSYKEISIGRVVVKKEYRRRKLGLEIINRAIDYIKNIMKENEIRISAQVYAKNLYKKAGFKEVSEEYLEDDIPHVEMLFK
ncbi:GNAT family N-acetyltransferase [Clostridium isatidis]|uniref:GNAT family N-acetyltransferase n=1 Tax=Clostridium isatidis TaxID=182773 RepID=A0A343JBI5_9CLOT|nr:GNAT family N-acetyltransferase [Clostridium isatidis]ASW42893.1 GNAT family N-acetyltransferase [Clostridium isatidis]NLZ35315.1 GNAT family N-acetyltransferase [Clostridiales bacterium]